MQKLHVFCVIYAAIKITIPLIVHPETLVQLPESSHVTVVGFAVPLYPAAQATDEVPRYVVADVPVNAYPVTVGVPQSVIE